jgi:hypothetical protein
MLAVIWNDVTVLNEHLPCIPKQNERIVNEKSTLVEHSWRPRDDWQKLFCLLCVLKRPVRSGLSRLAEAKADRTHETNIGNSYSNCISQDN